MIFPRNAKERKLCPKNAAFILIALSNGQLLEVRDQFPQPIPVEISWNENITWVERVRTIGGRVMTGVLIGEHPDVYSIRFL